MNKLKEILAKKPLQVILLLALVARMAAVIFSQGFGMHDDHFLVIEPAQAWADGINYQGWLPVGGNDIQPDGHSLLYSGIHFLIFKFIDACNLQDARLKMLFIRLLHAFLSLWVVSLGYKMAKRMEGDSSAITVGLLLALFWFMPMLSVRNLVEVVCIPFMMSGIWLLMKGESRQDSLSQYFFAGLLMGIGFSIRFQTAVFIGGTGLALLLLRQWRGAFIYAAGVLAAIVPVQGLIDYYIWGYPFAEFEEYVRYNIQAATDYITGPWYNYILLLAGLLLPPVSLFLLAGFFRLWRKQLLVWLPAFLFLLFHSLFPNKQERFIFPIIPFVIVLGVAGWNQYLQSSAFWKTKTAWIKNSWRVFWIINLLILSVITISYSKKSRVEAMAYLSRYPGIEVLLLEDTNHGSAKMMPLFYLTQWPQVASLTTDGLSWHLPDPSGDTSLVTKAGFVCFFENTNLESRIAKMKKIIPELQYEATFEPGFLDELMFRLNPVNLNQTIIVYRNAAVFNRKIEP